ncbi:hypothetical protein H8K21_09265 [Undibacterium oligocarboniphilum]|nr:hypothetical protein [Undibacterium oligocarboniphilum]
MNNLLTIRTVQPTDYEGWRPLWDGYNAFYGRQGDTALPEEITLTTWLSLPIPQKCKVSVKNHH